MENVTNSLAQLGKDFEKPDFPVPRPVFHTPQGRLARPLPVAFQSTGLLSKRQQKRKEFVMPETPIKQRPLRPYTPSNHSTASTPSQSPCSRSSPTEPSKKRLVTEEPMSPVRGMIRFDHPGLSIERKPIEKRTLSYSLLMSHQPIFLSNLFFKALHGDIKAVCAIEKSLTLHPDQPPMENYFDERYQIASRLGHGAFSEAFHVQTGDGREFAIKKSQHPFNGYKDAVLRMKEVEMWLKIGKHPNCVELESCWIQSGYLYLQMELCEGGSLLSYLDEHDIVPELEVWNILCQITYGLEHIHKKGIVHCDLKPANIFIKAGKLKIGDFGLASFSPVERNVEREGDRTYMAPEVLSENSIDYSADIFSLGLILLEICTNVVLPENGPVWQQLREGNVSMDLKQTSPPMIDLIRSMLNPHPKMRPTASQILNHPILDLMKTG